MQQSLAGTTGRVQGNDVDRRNDTVLRRLIIIIEVGKNKYFYVKIAAKLAKRSLHIIVYVEESPGFIEQSAR